MKVILYWGTLIILVIISIWAVKGNGSITIVENKSLWFSVPSLVIGVLITIFSFTDIIGKIIK